MPNTQPGFGSDWWNRKTNTYSGCTCPPARYNPRAIKPTNPDCKQHGSVYLRRERDATAEAKEVI